MRYNGARTSQNKSKSKPSYVGKQAFGKQAEGKQAGMAGKSESEQADSA
jgi:hypothetical protein